MKINDALLNDVKRGKKKAVAELYQLLAPSCYTLCLRYARDTMHAQDLFHDGFLFLLIKLSKFKNKGNFMNWAKKVLLNFILQQIRKNKKIAFISIDDAPEVLSFSQEEVPLPALSPQRIINLLQKLPEGYRLVFNLFVFEEYSHKEIAKVLNISESTSKSQYHKARKFLRKLLKKENYYAERI